MTMRLSRRIRIKRGVGPQGIPSVSVDAATAARQYGPLGYDTGGAIQAVGEFYDIRAFQNNERQPLYHSPTPWFEGLDKPTKQPSVLPSSQPPPEALDQSSAASVNYHGQAVDFAGLMHAFMTMAEGMGPSMYEPSPDVPQSVMLAPGESVTTSVVTEAVVDEIATNEPASYQALSPSPEVVPESVPTIDLSASTVASDVVSTPATEDGLVALVQSMAEPLSALAKQQQEQAAQSLETMVQGQMSLMGSAVAADPALMELPIADMMLLGLGPGM